jgi:hypothetical protein
MALISEVEELKNWRVFAREARFVAQQMSDPKSRLIMLQIARGYDLLARHAERGASSAWPQRKSWPAQSFISLQMTPLS